MFNNNSNYFILILIMLILFSRDGEIKGSESIILITTVIAMLLTDQQRCLVR
ncbi:MAG: hypothetical protein LBT30_05180 [Clostridiales bacterium]|jgi:hypothetical protein|nr:hypothetical protein [Clostridiales bacterium]